MPQNKTIKNQRTRAKVLLISPLYSIRHTVGSARIAKFRKYLPEFGFDTCVLTTQAAERSDDSSIYRAFDPGIVYRRSQTSRVQDDDSRVTTRQKLVSWISWLSVPDGHIVWLPAAVIEGWRVIRREGVDAIVSSSPPEASHLVAACLAGITCNPWIADVRDGWAFESVKQKLRQENLRFEIEKYMERQVVKRSDAVVSVTEPITEYFRNTYPQFQKFQTITNGYDPDDWDNIEPASRDPEKFRIVHTGTLSSRAGTRDLMPVFRAFKLLGLHHREKVEVLLVGETLPHWRQALGELGLGETVKVVGAVSHSESLAYQQSADLLLLVSGEDRSVATSKLYEYLYSRPPVLGICHKDSAGAMIIRQTGAGWIVDPSDPNSIAASLEEIILRWSRSEELPQAAGIERFSRKTLTEDLANVLRRVIAKSQ